MIRIETKLSREDYTKLVNAMMRSKRSLRTLFWIGILLMLASAVNAVATNLESSIPTFIMGAVLVFIVPVIIRSSAGRIYDSSIVLTERVIYEIDDNGVNVTGESFTIELDWNRVRQVTEHPDFFLIWENAQMARGLPKRDFKANEITEFREVVRSQPELKHKMLKQS